MRTLLFTVMALFISALNGCMQPMHQAPHRCQKGLTRNEAIKLAYVELARSAGWKLGSAIGQYRVEKAILTKQFAYYPNQNPSEFSEPVWVVILARKLGGDVIEIYFVHSRFRVVRFK